jgi:pilus assembly protein CpaB
MRRINSRTLVAVLAVILAILGIASLVAYANGARERAFSGTETVSVWQVTKEVPAGTEASALDGSVEQVSLPRASVPASAVTSLGTVRGKVTTASLVPGEVLVTGRFGSEKDLEEVPVPKGLQEVTIELASPRVLGGVIGRGDRVGVVASYEGQTNFAVNRALVLSTTALAGAGQESDQASVGVSMQVRLALSPSDVEKVVHASEFGKVWLARQGKDADVGRQIVTLDDVIK